MTVFKKDVNFVKEIPDMGKIVIFKWNPSFSSYNMYAFLRDLLECRYNATALMDFNWSVHDYESVHNGDEFYWVKVGFGQTGIVGHGFVTSEPYEGEDWYGKGRQTFYVDFCPDVLLNPDALELLTCAELDKAIPSFEWSRGHSGLVLNENQAAALDLAWKVYLAEHEEEFEKKLKSDNDYLYMKKL